MRWDGYPDSRHHGTCRTYRRTFRRQYLGLSRAYDRRTGERNDCGIFRKVGKGASCEGADQYPVYRYE